MKTFTSMSISDADVATVKAMADKCEAYAKTLRSIGTPDQEPSECEDVAAEQEAFAALFRTVAFLADKYVEALPESYMPGVIQVCENT